MDRPQSNIPMILTAMRVVCVPIFIGVYFSAWLTRPAFVSAAIYAFACVTDMLDGYFARRFESCTPLGALLDPVADKFIVSTALMILAMRIQSPLHTICFITLLLRDIGMSSLREWISSNAPSFRDNLSVSYCGKVKTFAVMFALGAFMVADDARTAQSRGGNRSLSGTTSGNATQPYAPSMSMDAASSSAVETMAWALANTALFVGVVTSVGSALQYIHAVRGAFTLQSRSTKRDD